MEPLKELIDQKIFFGKLDLDMNVLENPFVDILSMKFVQDMENVSIGINVHVMKDITVKSVNIHLHQRFALEKNPLIPLFVLVEEHALQMTLAVVLPHQ